MKTPEIVKETLGAAKGLTKSFTFKNAFKGVSINLGKWFGVGFLIWFATQYAIPWVQKLLAFTGLGKYANASKAIAGTMFLVIGLLLSMINFTPVQLIATGIGLVGMIALITALAVKLIELVKNARAKIAGGM